MGSNITTTQAKVLKSILLRGGTLQAHDMFTPNPKKRKLSCNEDSLHGTSLVIVGDTSSAAAHFLKQTSAVFPVVTPEWVHQSVRKKKNPRLSFVCSEILSWQQEANYSCKFTSDHNYLLHCYYDIAYKGK